MTIRFLPVGPRTVLVELPGAEATLALLRTLQADPVQGLDEIVPGARTLMLRMAPGCAVGPGLEAQVRTRAGAVPPSEAETAGEITIPMVYDGEDLALVAAHLDLSVAEVITAHQAAAWQVAFCGFAPGFAYMSSSDPRFDLPRRAMPRVRIPAGSVALAAGYCGIYPQDTPGGWQLIGTTRLPVWDLSRQPPALLRPGMRVRFVEGRAVVHPSAAISPAPSGPVALQLLATTFPVLFQDEGRRGLAGQGVSASGALDRAALHRANRAVGNPAGAPALELMPGALRLRAGLPVTLALSGAVGAAQVIAGGAQIAVVPDQAFALDAGDVLQIAAPGAGMRGYLALRGGFDVVPVLGSAARDTLAGIGPAPLLAGAALHAAGRPAVATAAPEQPPALPRAGDLVTLPVVPGPRADWFPPAMLHHFLTQEWLVTPQSSRVGLRLAGAQPVLRTDQAELPSEGTETGAIQIPHNGQPVLFLADHPLTGGYPVIATLLPEALDLAGQIPPGARIRFEAVQDARLPALSRGPA